MRCQFSGKNLDNRDVSLDGRVVPMNDTFSVFEIDFAE
jgi:hypothetical protein